MFEPQPCPKRGILTQVLGIGKVCCDDVFRKEKIVLHFLCHALGFHEIIIQRGESNLCPCLEGTVFQCRLLEIHLCHKGIIGVLYAVFHKFFLVDAVVGKQNIVSIYVIHVIGRVDCSADVELQFGSYAVERMQISGSEQQIV